MLCVYLPAGSTLELWSRDADDELIHTKMSLEEVQRPENGSASEGMGMCVGPVYSAAPTFLGENAGPELASASK